MSRTVAKEVEYFDFKILYYKLETPSKHKAQLNQEFKSWGTVERINKAWFYWEWS